MMPWHEGTPKMQSKTNICCLFRLVNLIGLFLIVLLLLCSSKGSKQAGSSSTGEIDKAAVLRYRLSGDPPTLDVAHSTDTQSAAVLLKIFDGLVCFDPVTLKVTPAVAKQWEISADGVTYTFHLRGNVYFHNGRKVVADDFRYSFERVLNPKTASERIWVLSPVKGAEAYNKGMDSHVTGIKVINDSTLVMVLEKPFSPFLGQLCMEAASAVPREEVERSDRDFTSHPVGCGPFKFISWKRGSEVIIEGFDKYYGGPAQYRGIQYKILPTVEVAYQQYVSGDIDFLDEIPQGRLKQLEKGKPLEFKKWPVLGIYYIGFNLGSPLFKNKTLRRAFCHAIDRQKICDVILEGASVPAQGILPPGIGGYDSAIEGYPYNPEKAKQLLADAGYPQGKGLPQITLWFNQNERHRRVVQFTQALLSDIGVNVTLKELEWGTYLQALQKGEPEFYRLGWIADLPDADNFLYPLLHSSQIGQGDNFSHFRNTQFDSLIVAARREGNAEKRIAIYQQADRLAVDEAAWIMISYNMDICLIKPEWKGVLLSRQGDFAVPLEKMYKSQKL